MKTLALLSVAALALSACGTTPTDRAITGGAMGGALFGVGVAATMALAAVPPFGIIPAVILGTALGASAGVVTTPDPVPVATPPVP